MKIVVKTNSMVGDGIVYVLELVIDGKKLVKIGVTSRKIEDRVVDILLDIFKKTREFPWCRPKRFTKVSDYLAKEKILLEMFAEYRYDCGIPFGGHTEVFDVDLDLVVEAYDRVVKGVAGDCEL